MTTSQVVRALESAKLLKRCEHPDDPRAKRIAVTEAGRAKAREAVVVVEQTDAEFFQPVAPRASALVSLLRALDESAD